VLVKSAVALHLQVKAIDGARANIKLQSEIANIHAQASSRHKFAAVPLFQSSQCVYAKTRSSGKISSRAVIAGVGCEMINACVGEISQKNAACLRAAGGCVFMCFYHGAIANRNNIAHVLRMDRRGNPCGDSGHKKQNATRDEPCL